jgi:hypothetical protein
MVLKPDNIPETMRDLRRWVVFKVFDDRKEPLSHNGSNGKANDSSTWSTLPEVLKAIEYGIGQYPALALSVDYQLRFFDLDDCIAPDGTLTPLAAHVVAAAPDTYIERSASGTGLHLLAWMSGAKVPKDRVCDGLEVYGTTPRFCIFTGDLYPGSAPHVNTEPPSLVQLAQSLAGNTEPHTPPNSLADLGTRSGKCGVVSAGAFRIPSVIPEGGRNSELARIARYFHNRNLTAELLPLMQLINTNRCKPPLPSAELDALVKSALSVKHQIVGTPPHNSDVATLLEVCAKAERLGMSHMDPGWVIDNVDAARTACREYIMGVKV